MWRCFCNGKKRWPLILDADTDWGLHFTDSRPPLLLNCKSLASHALQSKPSEEFVCETVCV